MTDADPTTFTAEFRADIRELVLQYEDGSLPVAAWNPSTVGIVASWYAQNLPRDQAKQRYELYYQRNRKRMANRLEGAAVNTAAIEEVDKVWESLLTRAFDSA